MNLQQILQQLPEGYCRFYREPSEYMHLLGDEQVARVHRFIAMTDDVGLPKISMGDWMTNQKTLPRRLKEFSEINYSRSGEYVVLRGDTYYAGYRLLNVKDREELAKTKKMVLQKILTTYEENETLIEEVRSFSGLADLVHEPHVYSLLELQKQISLSILKCYYRSMFKEGQGDKDSFNQLLELCAKTIDRAYKFIIEGKISDGRDLPEITKDESFPKICAEDFWRELDDPVKIALYCLNAAREIERPYELILGEFHTMTLRS